jgi:hypothetical protein
MGLLDPAKDESLAPRGGSLLVFGVPPPFLWAHQTVIREPTP